MEALILSCGTGGGHNAAGYAVKEELERRGHNVKMLDPYTLKGNHIDRLIDNAYIKLVQRVPLAFGAVYGLGNLYRRLPFRSPVYFLNRKMVPVMERLLSEKQYDYVVMPHLYPAEILTYMKKHGYHVPKMLFIATDYTCIPFTEETKVDYYFIPHEELATEFIKRGIPAEKLVPTGIPVSERFLQLPGKREARVQLGIPVDKSCILMMTGSMGYGRVENMTAKLVEQTGEDTHLYILGGTNEELKKTLRDRYADTERVHVLDFTTEAHLYMAAADILFTKPGGLTSTEAVAAKVALVHTKPIPGCEDRNVAFFTQHGMSVSGDTEDAVIQKGLKLLRDPEAQAEMRKCQEKYGKPYAADAVCEFICGQKEAAEAAQKKA